MRVAFIGRFQPLHWGHVKVLEWLSQSYGDILVIIGSADKGVTKDNPFTAGERMEMFLRTFGNRFALCAVPDTDGSSSLWGALIRHWCPRFDIAFSNNGYVRAALAYYGIKTQSHPFFDRDRLSGRFIRQLIASGSAEWRSLVPPSVAQFVDEIGGVERIQALYENT
jgi:nicotinamide-nucleotide adenylyltransferase